MRMDGKEAGITLAAIGTILVVAKLEGKIDWSWFWVTAPFWIGGICLILGCAMLIWLHSSRA